MKNIILKCSSFIVSLVVAASVSAHTTSIGFVPGANPGEVTFWTGSYQHGAGAPINEGTGTLVGVDVMFNQSQVFNIAVTGTKPGGLTDGTNNFYWDNPANSGACNQTGGILDMSLTADPGVCGGVVWWQGTTFTGLVPGTYDFSCGNNCGTTNDWRTWTAGSVRLTLDGSVIGGGNVPAPGVLGLMAIGLLGLGASRRTKQAA